LGTGKTGRLRALNDISFSVSAGQVVALVGESGSGKSTVLKILARLEQPSSGRFFLGDDNVVQREPRRASLAYRGRVQMIFQDPFGSLNPLHTVRYHLARPLQRHKKAGRAELEGRIRELLETVGLTPASEFAPKYPHQMSGGQRQRVAIARALAVEPELLLADEPISMLDVSIRVGILNLLLKLKQERNIATLYVTHDIASARYIGDRTMVMYAGQIVESAPSDTLVESPAHPYTKLLLSAVPDPSGSIESPLEAKSGSPKLVDPGPGCPFQERCPQALAVCREQNPPVIALSEEHSVRCHLHVTADE
jgi:peptide/nickel transport system ATP-binding protein